MVSKNEMPIYLISLKSDGERRKKIAESFPHHFNKMITIEAVDGRKLSAKEYYSKTLPYFMSSGKLMSPAELGCTLSHIHALEKFIASGESSALIIEDDIMGNDRTISDVFDINAHLNNNSLLICGGQDGLSATKYLFGRPVINNLLFRLVKFSHDHILRTCCYVVTRKSAKIILDKNKESLMIADSWGKYFIGYEIDIYFSNLFHHPVDLTSSHIEIDRAVFKKKSFLSKLRSVSYIGRTSKNIFFYVLYKCLGYKSLIV